VKNYLAANISAVKMLAVLLCFALSECDIWNKPLTQPIIDQLNATHIIELTRYPCPSTFYRGTPEPESAAAWEDLCDFKVMGIKGNLEKWEIPPGKLTISGFNSENVTREPQTIKVSYYDDYRGEVSAEFQILILEAETRLYTVSIPDDTDKNTGGIVVPFPSSAKAGDTVTVFVYPANNHILKPGSLKFNSPLSPAPVPLTEKSASGGFVFEMPACDIKLEAGFWDISSCEAVNVNKNARYSTLAEAVSNAGSTETIMIIQPEISITGKISIVSGNNITLRAMDGAEKKISRGVGCTDPLFLVESGASLTLDSAYSNGLIIDGKEIQASSPLIKIDGGSLTMGVTDKEGGTRVTLQNNKNNNADGGGGVFVSNGVFTMNGGTIRANETTGGEYHGGGVYADNGALVNICSGLIDGNKAMYGGGIQCGNTVSGNAVVNINGDVIVRNNEALMGAGINIDKGVLAMLAGTLTGNPAIVLKPELPKGGGVHINNGGTFNFTGGLISGNSISGTVASGTMGAEVYVEAGTFGTSGTAIVADGNGVYDVYSTSSGVITGGGGL
jgi:hypothetical protein